LSARLDYPLFWELTPAEIVRIVEASRKQDDIEHEAARIRNYELARLISFAQHDPKNMPSYKLEADEAKPESDEANQERARGAFIALALRSKG
jgi:hypothetical protein